MKVVVTGFDPFGGEAINPAFEAVKKLPAEIAGAEIIKVEVPTVFGTSGEKVAEAIEFLMTPYLSFISKQLKPINQIW